MKKANTKLTKINMVLQLNYRTQLQLTCCTCEFAYFHVCFHFNLLILFYFTYPLVFVLLIYTPVCFYLVCSHGCLLLFFSISLCTFVYVDFKLLQTRVLYVFTLIKCNAMSNIYTTHEIECDVEFKESSPGGTLKVSCSKEASFEVESERRTSLMLFKREFQIRCLAIWKPQKASVVLRRGTARRLPEKD